jgi:hypothetical protein
MIPVRFVFGEANNFTINTSATDIAVAVSRGVTVFPLPMSSQRVGVDTNLPQVTMNISGLLEDDDDAGVVQSPRLAYREIITSNWVASTIEVGPATNLLAGKSIRFLPMYWRNNSPRGRFTFIVLDFNSTVSNRAGGSAVPTVSTDVRKAWAENGNVHIDVPIGNVEAGATNGNPASTLALIIKDALELTTVIIGGNSHFGVPGAKRVADAFTVTTSQHANGQQIVRIEDKFQNENYARTPLDPDFRNAFSPSTLSTGLPSRYSFGKSAGDKAQDLLGLISNSRKESDLLRGIQIPYHSLVQSNDITPVVRNLFLTYGKLTPAEKGSRNNFRPATLPMRVSNTVGEDEGGRSTGLLANLVDGLWDYFGEAWATLAGKSAVGNQGGLSVVPTKLHIKKEGADGTYRYDLQLMSADHVIGV